jgi:Domain of unknown function (DUF222)/HNH endonuclease
MHATSSLDGWRHVSADTSALVPVLSSASTVAHDTHTLGDTIASIAAGLHAATYQLLVLLREFDARNGWNNGFLSCAHWLHWRTGFDLGASREKVRVARALPALPRIALAMERGQLSYAKVRALTRVATPENEAALLNVALAGTAAQVERFVRARRRVDRATDAQVDEARYLNRTLSMWVDDDGMVMVRGRLTPEAGAVVMRAVEAAADRLFREARDLPAAPTLTEDVTPAQRRADALVLVAEAALTADLDRGHAGDRYHVVVHVDASTDAPAPVDTDPRVLARLGLEPATAVIELDHDALHVSAETSRRLSCDAAVVTMTHDVDGSVLDAGRRTRTIPPAIRRALTARDRTCRFPGCTSRRCDAHHIEHWADGGATRLDNLVLLCRRHHRAVHEGGFCVSTVRGGAIEFQRPDGRPLPATGRLVEPREIVAAVPKPPPPTWDGTPFDVAWAIDVLWRAVPG